MTGWDLSQKCERWYYACSKGAEPSRAPDALQCDNGAGGGGEEKVHSKLLYLKILLYS
jgi:hypothetical protein